MNETNWADEFNKAEMFIQDLLTSLSKKDKDLYFAGLKQADKHQMGVEYKLSIYQYFDPEVEFSTVISEALYDWDL